MGARGAAAYWDHGCCAHGCDRARVCAARSAERVEQLGECMQLPPAEASAIAYATPSLLKRSPDAWANALAVLSRPGGPVLTLDAAKVGRRPSLGRCHCMLAWWQALAGHMCHPWPLCWLYQPPW